MDLRQHAKPDERPVQWLGCSSMCIRPGYNGAVSWELIGHGWAEALLRQHISRGSVRHAYLITGAAGLGKRTLALRFAQALNCSNASAGELCGQDDCRSCTLTPAESYPDLHLVAPNGSTKIDEIRELQAKTALAPYEGRWRVAVLTDFQLATSSAANAMLKLLEEPPPQVVLLLTAPDRDALPPTVVSRCEQLQLRPVSREVIGKALRQRGLEDDQAEFLATLAAGRPGLAIRLVERPELLEQRREALDSLQDLLQLAPVERFGEVERLIGKGPLPEQRQRVLDLIEHWMGLWRDLVLAGYQVDREALNSDVIDQFAAAAASVPAQRRTAGLEALVQAQTAIGDYANLRLSLEGLLLVLPVLAPSAELG